MKYLCSKWKPSPRPPSIQLLGEIAFKGKIPGMNRSEGNFRLTDRPSTFHPFLISKRSQRILAMIRTSLERRGLTCGEQGTFAADFFKFRTWYRTCPIC